MYMATISSRILKGFTIMQHFRSQAELDSLTHSQALQPMQGLGRLKKSPPAISILGLDPLISESQPLCIPHHSIHPSEVWPSHSLSALRLVQCDFLTWYIILHSYYMSCPSESGYPNCCYQVSFIIQVINSSLLYVDPHVAPSQIGP
jgi:hypothetical protein